MPLNCTDADQLLMKYYLSPVYALEFTLGFLGNLVVVLGYPLCLLEWRSTNVYLYNLAVSDSIFLCTLPRLSYLYANEMDETSPPACVFNRYMLHVNLYSSILFMALVSVDRFLLLCHPHRNHVFLTRKAAICASLVVWLLVNIEMAPIIYYNDQNNLENNGTKCNDFASLSKTWGFFGYSMGLTLLGYLVPLLALFISSRRIASVLTTQEEAFKNRAQSFKRPLFVVRAAFFMFLLLYTPYHVMRNVRIASRLNGQSDCSVEHIESVYIVTRPIAFSHSVINPVFYFLMSDQFRELLVAKLQSLKRRIVN
ncbi:succinate receptor 1-like [Denticeps clupeoides]|uniref:G-protein coupled receptors family 1 profile domain-containing protein n=1 Tax=Denticeps clupeoides TaxID=299321 RepID=A0AAY4DL62_9TELE|nr:succinate receptor 1 [Denticeps clupeoides]